MIHRVIICCGNKNVSVRVRTRAAQEQTNTMNQRLDLLSDASTLSRPGSLVGSLVGTHFELILCTKLTFSLVSDWITRPIRSYIPRAFQVVEHRSLQQPPMRNSPASGGNFRCQHVNPMASFGQQQTFRHAELPLNVPPPPRPQPGTQGPCLTYF